MHAADSSVTCTCVLPAGTTDVETDGLAGPTTVAHHSLLDEEPIKCCCALTQTQEQHLSELAVARVIAVASLQLPGFSAQGECS